MSDHVSLRVEDRGPHGRVATIAVERPAKLNTLDLANYKLILVSSKALETIIARVNGGTN